MPPDYVVDIVDVLVDDGDVGVDDYDVTGYDSCPSDHPNHGVHRPNDTFLGTLNIGDCNNDQLQLRTGHASIQHVLSVLLLSENCFSFNYLIFLKEITKIVKTHPETIFLYEKV